MADGVTQKRRMGAEDSLVRTQFVDAAEAILCEEGDAGVSARRIAQRAGLKTQLLYYYFRTMDDLLLAVVRRVNGRRLERFEAAMASDDPLHALWALNVDPSGASLAAALTVAAGRRDAIRTEIIASAEQFRSLQVDAVQRLIGGRDGKSVEGPAAAGIVMIAAALARALVTEAALGLTYGHKEALDIVERTIASLVTRS